MSKHKTPTSGFNNKIPEKIMTPDKVETRLGMLNFEDGVPTPETTKKLYDNLDFMRGTEVFLNFIPACSIEAIRQGCVELGATKYNQPTIYDQLADSNPLLLTANTDTVYCIGFIDLGTDGPTVIEVPPGCGPATVDDAFFRFVIDMGLLGKVVTTLEPYTKFWPAEEYHQDYLIKSPNGYTCHFERFGTFL